MVLQVAITRIVVIHLFDFTDLFLSGVDVECYCFLIRVFDQFGLAIKSVRLVGICAIDKLLHSVSVCVIGVLVTLAPGCAERCRIVVGIIYLE